MAILLVRLCRIFRRSFFLFPFGKCPLAIIAFIILPNHRQQTPCQRLIYKLWKLSGVTSKLNPHFKRLWDPYCDTKNAICSTEFIVYRPRTAWTRPFCYAVLNSDAFYTHMAGKAISSTGSRKRIQPDVSASFVLAIPDNKTMRAFVELYAPIMEKQKALYKENRELAKLRDWLEGVKTTPTDSK